MIINGRQNTNYGMAMEQANLITFVMETDMDLVMALVRDKEMENAKVIVNNMENVIVSVMGNVMMN